SRGSDLGRSRGLEVMDGSKPCSSSGKDRAPDPMRTGCSLRPLLSPSPSTLRSTVHPPQYRYGGRATEDGRPSPLGRVFPETVPALNPRTVAEPAPSPPLEERVGERRPYLSHPEPGSRGGRIVANLSRDPSRPAFATRRERGSLSLWERAGVRGNATLPNPARSA